MANVQGNAYNFCVPQESSTPEPQPQSVANWFGINRATLAVLVAIGGLGLSEEIWRSYFGIHLRKESGDILQLAVFAVFVNFLEGFGYIIGGTVAHKLGARSALAVSALPVAIGFGVMLSVSDPWFLVAGALLITNWEPLSVPATFDVVGSELPKNRRTIAFAMQSIQKRVPKVLGPLIGGLAFLKTFKLNIALALGILGVSILTQIFLLSRMKPKPEPKHVPLKEVLRNMPPDLRMLLSAEILLRWGDWFVRDFAGVYVVFHLQQPSMRYGELAALTSFTALVTYIPVGKLVDRAASPKPYIGLTFLLFSLFPICLVLLPKSGLPLSVALAITFIVNGLRELGEPARKAMIASGFPPEYRARAVGLYWGLRSFAFFPAPIVAYLLWKHLGPDATFLIGGGIGLLGTAWFWLRVQCRH
jgi:predicted MFS family arabinose efflux permease